MESCPRARMRHQHGGHLFLGIDFGTTHSSMTVLEDGASEARVVPITPNDEPYDAILRTAAFIPSELSLDSDGIGQIEVHSINFRKGKLGQRKGLLLKHFKPYFRRFHLKHVVTGYTSVECYDPLLEMNKDRQHLVHRVFNKPYSREEIVWGAAAVLRRLKDGLIEKLNRRPEHAQHILLGNPVGFTGFARARLLDACFKSGIVGSARDALRRVRFVYEPVAVACESVVMGRRSQRVLVFDFGGGTLDLALVRFEPDGGVLHPVEIEEVRGIALAGHHIDWQILAYLRQRDQWLQDAYITRSQTNPHALQELLEFVEGMKKDLSRQLEVHHPYGARALRLTRAELEGVLKTLLRRVCKEVKSLLAALGPEAGGVDRVVTAGGSSLIPAVQDALRSCFADFSKQPQFSMYAASSDQRGGDVEKALVGVARGLSRSGQRYALREQTDRSLHLLLSDDQSEEVLASRQPFQQVNGRFLAVGPELQLSLPAGRGCVTLVVYEQGLVGLEYLVQYVDIPAAAGVVKCQCIWEKGAFLPSFRVDGKIYDPIELDEESLRALLSADEAVLSFGGPKSPRLPCFQVGLGDEIEYQIDGLIRQGTVTQIVHCDDTLRHLQEAEPNLSNYRFRTVRKDGRSPLFQTRSSDVKILQRAQRHQDTIEENLFTSQLRQELETGL